MVHCPRCLVERLRKPEGEHAGRPCRSCRGAWLPTASADRLIVAPFGPLAALPRLPTGIAALRCPECGAELERRQVAGVEIDVCPDHGVWFDHQEIDRVRAAAERHRHGEPLAVAELAAAAVAAVVVTPTTSHASQSDGVALELAAETTELAVATAEAATGSGDVTVAVLEVVDVGEVAGGALELLSDALDALLSGL